MKARRTELKKWEEGNDEETHEEGEPSNGNKMTRETEQKGKPTKEGEAEGESGSFDLGKGWLPCGEVFSVACVHE